MMTPMTDEYRLQSDNPPRRISADWGRALMRLVTTWLVTFQQGLPLFRREMLVQSWRVRTYVIRSVFAIVLFCVALCYAAVVTGTPLIGAAVKLPGEGRVILDGLVWMLFGLIYVFAPATASGVITLEREQQTLVLLYLTKLTAWHIVLEKFLSRLLPLLAILLLSLPLLVFAHAFGGVSVAMLGTSVWFLLVTAIQVTALAVLCSTLCRRTTHAFILTYGLLLAIYLGPLFVDIWLFDGSVSQYGNYSARLAALQNSAQTASTLALFNAPPPAIPPEYSLFACCPPALFGIHYEPAVLGTSFSWSAMLTAGLPTLASAVLCLLLAPLLVFYHVIEQRRFNPFERFQTIANYLGAGRRTLASQNGASRNSQTDLPLNDPITWRESTKGSRNWLVVIFVLEIPALVLAVWLARTAYEESASVATEICGLWAVGALLICVHTASLITRERSQQTLDLLLTTPLTSAEIVQQKFDGIRNVMIACAIPLFSCMLFQAWWRATIWVPRSTNVDRPGDVFVWWEYLITNACCIVIYFQLIGWLALWAGLKSKSPTRATLSALGGLLCFCGAPQFLLIFPLLVLMPMHWYTDIRFTAVVFAQTTPIFMIGLSEFTNLRALCEVPLLPAIVNTAFYGALLVWGRRYVLDRADVLLGRTVHY